ncbi:uncharacterized protein LACBIDRAFT_315696 [Laccaria bicolor S238N-H82]|uniref:Predicted protein n=1 Tax=Laccaria bicolor (strain S238N-H82 / ATCC MYA-4686) TaxID=486041 RepID=B0D2Y8_LACBS|nr:uncharacterized protein LACBIDRAFT_315696 [Laccaria bicolor S238N-H82]EDR10833.1 predicted protein [Laccaria bicolor S238N-H82]|eukprot:XP_001878134.1 predicted protein [Laccaria bicolor S238N-H82]
MEKPCSRRIQILQSAFLVIYFWSFKRKDNSRIITSTEIIFRIGKAKFLCNAIFMEDIRSCLIPRRTLPQRRHVEEAEWLSKNC